MKGIQVSTNTIIRATANGKVLVVQDRQNALRGIQVLWQQRIDGIMYLCAKTAQQIFEQGASSEKPDSKIQIEMAPAYFKRTKTNILQVLAVTSTIQKAYGFVYRISSTGCTDIDDYLKDKGYAL